MNEWRLNVYDEETLDLLLIRKSEEVYNFFDHLICLRLLVVLILFFPEFLSMTMKLYW